MSIAYRLALLGQEIEQIRARSVADAVPRRRGVTRREHVASFYDPHAAVECASMIERFINTLPSSAEQVAVTDPGMDQ